MPAFQAQPVRPNFTSGEVSPLIKGRVDVSRFFSGASRVENFFPLVQGGLTKRPGTTFVANTKDNAKVKLVPFIFNEEQSLMMEFGNLYVRFYTNGQQVTQASTVITNVSTTNPVTVTAAGHGFTGGERVVILNVLGTTEVNNREFEVTNVAGDDFDLLGIDGTGFTTYISGGTVAEIFEIVSPYTTSQLFEFQYAQSADVMYITHKDVLVHKLTRTGALAFTLAAVSFFGGGLDFSAVNDRPSSVSFLDQRLVFARTNDEPTTIFLSVAGDLENFTLGTNPDDAIKNTIAGVRVDEIRWLSPTSKVLGVGTDGSEYTASSNDRNDAITTTNFRINPHTFYGSAAIQPVQMEVSTLYIQRGKRRVFDFTYSFERDGFVSDELTILNDQILLNEAVDMAYQQEPNNNVWVATDSAHMAVVTYRRSQDVIGWARIILGGTDSQVEAVSVIPALNEDEVWISVARTVGGVTVRFIERFNQRFIETELKTKEDAIFVDSSLSFESTAIDITDATQADPVVVTTGSPHGLSNGDTFKIRKVKGMVELNDRSFKAANVTANTVELTDRDDNDIDGTGFTEYDSAGNLRAEVSLLQGLNHLIGEEVLLLVDGRAHPETTVSSNGNVTLEIAGSIIHVGLPYTALVETLPFEQGNPLGTVQGKKTAMHRVAMRFYQTLGGQVSISDGDKSEIVFNQFATISDESPPLFTGIPPITYPFNSLPKEPVLTYENTTAFPATLLNILPEYRVMP